MKVYCGYFLPITLSTTAMWPILDSLGHVDHDAGALVGFTSFVCTIGSLIASCIVVANFNKSFAVGWPLPGSRAERRLRQIERHIEVIRYERGQLDNAHPLCADLDGQVAQLEALGESVARAHNYGIARALGSKTDEIVKRNGGSS